MTPLCRRPGIFLAEGFATSSEIDAILAAVGDEAALTARGLAWKHDETGLSTELPVAALPLLRDLSRRIQDAVGLGNDFDETMRFRHYRPGEYHPPHCDHFSWEGRELLATAMLHLCDPAEGGETWFPAARPEAVRVAPRKGRLVVWHNHRPDGTPDPLSRHEGLPVLAGEKSTLTSFLYRPRAEARLLASR